MDRERILSAVFSFDELNARTIPDARRTAVVSWLLENPARWRLADNPIDVEASTQFAIIIKGEEGSGKTTELRILSEKIAQGADNLPLLLDFTTCSEEHFELSLPRFFRDQIHSLMRAHDLFIEYRVALIRQQLNQDVHPFRDLQIEARGDFSTWSDDRILTDPRIKTACAIYESSNDPAAQYLSIRAAQMLPRRAYFLIDNSDLLGAMRVQLLARLLSRNLQSDSYLIATTRPENHRSWARGANERRTLRTIDLHSSSRRLVQIARQRLVAADEFVTTKMPDIVTDFTERTGHLRKALKDIEDDPAARSLVSDWHNRSVRQMLPSLLTTAAAYADRHANESLHGIVFRTLVQQSMPESMIEIYTAEFPKTTGKGKFIFLRLRILAYLFKRRSNLGTLTAEQVAHDFRTSFGVETEETIGALRAMSEHDHNPAIGLLRLERIDDTEQDSVVLLSAGQCMIEHVITSCDFLSWVYDRTPQLERISGEGKSISQLKLEKSVKVIRDHILPLLVLEHPYMEAGRRDFRRDRDLVISASRLRCYRTMFGYYSGHWFIASLTQAVRRYAAARPDRISDRTQLDALGEVCDRYVRNLDSVADWTTRSS